MEIGNIYFNVTVKGDPCTKAKGSCQDFINLMDVSEFCHDKQEPIQILDVFQQLQRPCLKSYVYCDESAHFGFILYSSHQVKKS